MSVSGQVLVVDDDPAFVLTYEDILRPEGYVVESASDATQAQAKIRAGGWDVVILDQKLQGPDGGDTGLSLIAETAATGAKVIVATGYASAEAITRAFRDGAYDYIQKGELLSSLVRVKVRNAATEVQERRLASMSPDERELAIRETWSSVRTEKVAARKGKLLEDLLVLLFKTLPGLKHVDTRVKSRDEEIDLLVHNESTDPFWQKESAYFIVECKNWTEKVGPEEFDRLVAKMERRFQRCRLGLLVSVNGFTEGVSTTLLAERKGDSLVILVNRADLDALVIAKDRMQILRDLHTRAVAAAASS